MDTNNAKAEFSSSPYPYSLRGQQSSSSMESKDENEATIPPSKLFPTQQTIISTTVSSPSTNLKTTGLEESDYYAYYSKRYGNAAAGGSISSISIANHQENEGHRIEKEMTIISAVVADSIELGEGVMHLLSNENKDEKHAMIEYLPRTAALLLSALQDALSTKLETIILQNNDENENDDGKRNANNSSLLENLLLHCTEANDADVEKNCDIDDEYVASSMMLSSTPHPPSVMLEQIEEYDKEADALFNSIINMECMYSQSPRTSEQEEFIRDGLAAAGDGSDALQTSTMFVDDDSDDEGSIQGDIARLTRSISCLQRDLESADYSFLNDDEHAGELVGDHHRNRCWNDKVKRFKLWISRSSIVEQKLLHTLVGGVPTPLSSGVGGDNPILIHALLLRLVILVLMILMLLRLSLFIDGGSSIDGQGQLADIVEWWLFRR